jgi:hypothetical protein
VAGGRRVAAVVHLDLRRTTRQSPPGPDAVARSARTSSVTDVTDAGVMPLGALLGETLTACSSSARATLWIAATAGAASALPSWAGRLCGLPDLPAVRPGPCGGGADGGAAGPWWGRTVVGPDGVRRADPGPVPGARRSTVSGSAGPRAGWLSGISACDERGHLVSERRHG